MKLLKYLNFKKFLFFLLSVLLFFFDQLTKYYVVLNSDFLIYGIKITPFFNLVYVINKGISFGLLADLNISFYLGIFSFIASIFIVIWMLKTKIIYETLALSMILGGALGNGFDRIKDSYVVDFIDVHISNYHWPAFNFADLFICLGAIIYISQNLFSLNELKK
ncbi:MAG: signal peptidase II [Rickettsiales bacterium]|nr:signal peptidase II [Rickettsiales bacterium]|tara:strand:+ start:3315 stop:3806 length:492 start_codon:yes stop_codon:yes gene_type:complete